MGEKITKKLNKKDKQLLLSAQLVKFAKILAENNKKIRDKTLKNLSKYLIHRSQASIGFSENDFMKLWKGLFYYMWWSDKLLPQEEDAEKISKLIHNLTSIDEQLLFYKAFLSTMSNEWFRIDQYRVDKFLMLSRRMLRQTFIALKTNKWRENLIKKFNKNVLETNISNVNCLGFTLHFIEIFLEELAKISRDKLNKKIFIEVLRPFVVQLATTDDERFQKHIVKFIFEYLIKQSDLGLDYQEKLNIWKSLGRPNISISSIKLPHEEEKEEEDYETDDESDTSSFDGWVVESIENEKIKQKNKKKSARENNDDKSKTTSNDVDNDDDEKLDGPLDPRAGKVDVELIPLDFDSNQIVNLLNEYRYFKSSNVKSRKKISRLINLFTTLSKGIYPLEIKILKQKSGEEPRASISIDKEAKHLLKFEEEIIADKKLTRKQKLLLKQGVILEKEVNETKPNGVLKTKTKKEKKNEKDANEKKKRKIENVELEDVVKSKKQMLTKNNLKKKKDSSETETSILIKDPTHKFQKKKEKTPNFLTGKHKTPKTIQKTKSPNKKEAAAVTTTNGKLLKSIEKNNLQTSGVQKKIAIKNKEETPKVNNVKKKNVKTNVNNVSNNEEDTNEDLNDTFENALGKWTDNLLKRKKDKKPDLLRRKDIKTNGKIKKKVQTKSEKKVKFALAKNISQKRSEYIKLVKTSPLPYDATKQPTKPLLKKSLNGPIDGGPKNSFYNFKPRKLL